MTAAAIVASSKTLDWCYWR